MSREQEILGRALEFDDPAERRGYLVGACGEDSVLLKQVEELLVAFSGAEEKDFLPAALGDAEAPIREGEGSVVGRYKLLQKLGEGGFGVVYMAEQREPVKRRVALKIIKLGMDTKQVVGRFEAERQALAMMDHPNIAKVLDGGATDQGRPYFVMELVRGIPVTDFCDEKLLTTSERLGLYLQICDAVQHAHQKGVIHRDLKPANVLVSPGDGNRPHPKVIDFGIAKATQQELTERTLFTRFEDFVGTPAYMSPEQAQYSQLDIDTRTDVYSLGVLLYELLTGHTPFDSDELLKSGIDEIRRRIREDEPPRPSTRLKSMELPQQTRIAEARKAEPQALRGELRHEIDWIVMKAIEKDRDRRYGTAEALGEDIRRYLNGDAVEACPPTPGYRLRKWIGRNRGAFAVAASIAAALAIAAVVSTWQAVRVSDANRRATESLADSYLHQARAIIKTAQPGRHYDALAAVRKAAQIRPTLALRNEAIAALALADMRRTHPIDLSPATHPKTVARIDAAGERYATGNAEGSVRLYRVSDQTLLEALPEIGGRVVALEFSNGGRHLAVTTQDPNAAVIRDLKESREVLRIEDAHWGSLDLSPDDQRVAVGLRTAKRVDVFHLETNERTASIPFGRVPGNLRFSPGGERLLLSASGLNPSQEMQIVALPRGEELLRLANRSVVKSVAWHPSGEWVAAGLADYTIAVWDVAAATEVRILRGHRAEVVNVAFHPSGRFLASGSWDGTTRIWEPNSGECVLKTSGSFQQFVGGGRFAEFSFIRDGGGLWEFTTGSDCFSHFHFMGDSPRKGAVLAFSPNGRWLAGGAQELRIWNLADGRSLVHARAAAATDVTALAFDPGGLSLHVGDHHSGLWRSPVHADGSGGLSLDERTELFAGRVLHFAPGPDGRTLAVVLAGERKVHLLDPEGGGRELPAQPGINSVAIDPTGRWLAGGCWKGSGARVWDLDAPEASPVDLLTQAAATKTWFSPDGKTLVVGYRDGYQFLETGTWKESAHVAKTVARDTSSAFAFHPGAPLLAASIDGHRIALIDPMTHATLAQLRPPRAEKVNNLHFSPDGTHLAATATSRDVFVWNLEKLREEERKLGFLPTP